MKPICLTLLSLLGLGLATMEATAETWPTKPLRVDRALRGGEHHRHHPTRGVRAALVATRPEHRRGEPYRRRRNHRYRLRRQG